MHPTHGSRLLKGDEKFLRSLAELRFLLELWIDIYEPPDRIMAPENDHVGKRNQNLTFP